MRSGVRFPSAPPATPQIRVDSYDRRKMPYFQRLSAIFGVKARGWQSLSPPIRPQMRPCLRREETVSRRRRGERRSARLAAPGRPAPRPGRFTRDTLAIGVMMHAVPAGDGLAVFDRSPQSGRGQAGANPSICHCFDHSAGASAGALALAPRGKRPSAAALTIGGARQHRRPCVRLGASCAAAIPWRRPVPACRRRMPAPAGGWRTACRRASARDRRSPRSAGFRGRRRRWRPARGQK